MKSTCLCFPGHQFVWLQCWGLEFSKGSLRCLVLDAGHWLGPLLGLQPDYLHLTFPCGCLASSQYSGSVPRMRWEIRGQVEAIWSLSPSFEVTQCHFCLILFIRSESLRYQVEMWLRYRNQHAWKVELFNSEQDVLSLGINHFVWHRPWPVQRTEMCFWHVCC